jgi:hypothetical protein
VVERGGGQLEYTVQGIQPRNHNHHLHTTHIKIGKK